MSLGAQLAEVGGRLFGWAEGNQVAQSFIDGEEPDALAVRLGVVRAMQLVGAKSAHEEMSIVDEGVFHTGVGEIGGDLGLPHALGEPQSRRGRAEAPLEILAHAADLLEAVGAGQGREDRLVETREQKFELAIGREPSNEVQPRGVVSLQPLEQRSGHM